MLFLLLIACVFSTQTLNDACKNCDDCLPSSMKNFCLDAELSDYNNASTASTKEEIESVVDYIITKLNTAFPDDDFTSFLAAYSNNDFYQFTNCKTGEFGAVTQKDFCDDATATNFVSICIRNDLYFEDELRRCYFLNSNNEIIWDTIETQNGYNCTERPYYTQTTDGWTDNYEYAHGGSGSTYKRRLTTDYEDGCLGCNIGVFNCPDIPEPTPTDDGAFALFFSIVAVLGLILF